MTGPAVHVAGTRTFAAEVIDFAQDAGITVVGLLEPYDRTRVGTATHERPVVWLEDGPAEDGAVALLGTGEPRRRELVSRLRSAGFEVGTLVHPRAHLAPTTTVGAGALIAPGAVVGARATIGECAVVGRGALVGHHTRVGDFATLGPGANVAGNVEVGDDAFIAMGAVVRDHTTVGRAAVVAMGSVVVADVADGAQVRGLPARES